MVIDRAVAVRHLAFIVLGLSRINEVLTAEFSLDQDRNANGQQDQARTQALSRLLHQSALENLTQQYEPHGLSVHQQLTAEQQQRQQEHLSMVEAMLAVMPPDDSEWNDDENIYESEGE